MTKNKKRYLPKESQDGHIRPSNLRQDRFREHFGSQTPSNRRPKMDHFGIKITTCQYVTKTHYLLHFSYVSGLPRPPKISSKSVEKITLKPDPLKFVNFRLLESPRQAQEAKRLPKECPKGGQSGAKMTKNDVQKGVEIRGVSKGVPKWLRWCLEGASGGHLG